MEVLGKEFSKGLGGIAMALEVWRTIFKRDDPKKDGKLVLVTDDMSQAFSERKKWDDRGMVGHIICTRDEVGVGKKVERERRKDGT